MHSRILSSKSVITAEDKPVGVQVVLERILIHCCARFLSDRGVIAGQNETIPIYVSNEHTHSSRSVAAGSVLVGDSGKRNGDILPIANPGQLNRALV